MDHDHVVHAEAVLSCFLIRSVDLVHHIAKARRLVGSVSWHLQPSACDVERHGATILGPVAIFLGILPHRGDVHLAHDLGERWIMRHLIDLMQKHLTFLGRRHRWVIHRGQHSTTMCINRVELWVTGLCSRHRSVVS